MVLPYSEVPFAKWRLALSLCRVLALPLSFSCLCLRLCLYICFVLFACCVSLSIKAVPPLFAMYCLSNLLLCFPYQIRCKIKKGSPPTKDFQWQVAFIFQSGLGVGLRWHVLCGSFANVMQWTHCTSSFWRCRESIGESYNEDFTYSFGEGRSLYA